MRSLLPAPTLAVCSVTGIHLSESEIYGGQPTGSVCWQHSASECAPDGGLYKESVQLRNITAARNALSNYLSRQGLQPDGDIIAWNDTPGRTAGEVAHAMQASAQELETAAR